MSVFDNAQIGDLVYCRISRQGQIYVINYEERNLLVSFDNCVPDSRYDFDGKYYGLPLSEQILFYRDHVCNYLLNRPIISIDYKMVPVDTKIKLENQIKCYYAGDMYVWENGKTSWTATIKTSIQNSKLYLAETLIIDKTRYPIGTIVK